MLHVQLCKQQSGTVTQTHIGSLLVTFSIVTCAIITTIKGIILENITIFICKCQYLSVTFAKKINLHKTGKETQDE